MSGVEFFHGKDISYITEKYKTGNIHKQFIENKRKLTASEIQLLVKNNNISSDWSQIFVTDNFEPDLIKNSEFHGIVVIGNMSKGILRYHDLVLQSGIYDSTIISSIIYDNVAIKNVKYLANFIVEKNVILFNIDELSCTDHPKFGNGILKDGEKESDRVFIEISNENGGRKILPFEGMITADAYLWSQHRDDINFQKKIIEITEMPFSKKRGDYGIIGESSVIKNTLIIKDALIGSYSYIKGASKLKNITILSSADEPSQIGEGVEMVNGIMGYNSKVFYQAVLIRFVIGRNCQVKYGARVLNTVLGDNSTVSCCEMLNNLVFPFHEQHHNSSFLIAATVMGQSNIAAGATIGSNHNSRSPDGEIIAGRGFWPGLCTNFKHNSKFASFSLVAKGSYQQELNIPYPFALIFNDCKENTVQIMPAYWFMYNMYALARNSYKFKKRDKRKIKIQNIEIDYLAPDTISEILFAMERIKKLSENHISINGRLNDIDFDNYIISHISKEFILHDPDIMKKYGGNIVKPLRAYREYKKMVEYFAAKTIVNHLHSTNINNESSLKNIYTNEVFLNWVNVGGQVMPEQIFENIITNIKNGSITSWSEIHNYYDKQEEDYALQKVRYAMFVIEKINNKTIIEMNTQDIEKIVSDATIVAETIYQQSYSSRNKDYKDPFRLMTYKSEKEMISVVGDIADNDFLIDLREETEILKKRLPDLLDIRSILR